MSIQQLSNTVTITAAIPPRMESITAKIQKLLITTQDQKVQIAELQKQNQALTGRAEQAEQANTAKDAQINQLNTSNGQQTRTIEQKTQENETLKKTNEDLNKRLEDLMKQLSAANAALSGSLDGIETLLKDV